MTKVISALSSRLRSRRESAQVSLSWTADAANEGAGAGFIRCWFLPPEQTEGQWQVSTVDSSQYGNLTRYDVQQLYKLLRLRPTDPGRTKVDTASPWLPWLYLLQQAINAASLGGLYALFAPRSFYDDFPAGRGWVEALPAYNEHLVRDVGALFIATAIVLAAAAIWLDRRLVLVALVSFLAFSIPHTTYHLFNLGGISTGDAVAEAVSLLFTVIAPLVLLVATLRAGRPPDPG